MAPRLSVGLMMVLQLQRFAQLTKLNSLGSSAISISTLLSGFRGTVCMSFACSEVHSFPAGGLRIWGSSFASYHCVVFNRAEDCYGLMTSSPPSRITFCQDSFDSTDCASQPNAAYRSPPSAHSRCSDFLQVLGHPTVGIPHVGRA